MAEYLTREQYAELQGELEQDRARLVFSRAMARKFFTHVGNRNVRDLTGKSVLGSKTVVLGLLLASILSILGALLLVVRDFGVISIIAVPLVGTFWTIIVAFTTEHGSTLASTALLILALAVTWLLPVAYAGPIGLFFVSIYLYRLAHNLSHYFLCRLVRTSYDAYDMLAEQIAVKRNAD